LAQNETHFNLRLGVFGSTFKKRFCRRAAQCFYWQASSASCEEKSAEGEIDGFAGKAEAFELPKT